MGQLVRAERNITSRLQQLGGWASYAMSVPLCTFSAEMLANAANNIGTILTQSKKANC